MENIKTKKLCSWKGLTASILLIIFMILTPIGILAGGIFLIPNQYEKTFSAALPDKYERLSTVSGKKIVVIGGSSVAFALDSQLLESKSGMPVVNFGLYASLGTRVMMELAEEHIGTGDIVILSPETDSQTLSMYFGAETMWQAVEADRSIFEKLPSDMKKEMLLQAWAHAVNKCQLWNTGTPDPSGIYRKDSFDEYGDLSYERPESLMITGYDASKIIEPSGSLFDDEFIQLTNDFTVKAEEKGAAVYFAFCPMNSAALGENVTDESLYDYFLFLSSNLECPVIGDINNSIMDPGYFYDSNFHLNDSGSIVWTANLAADIRRTLGIVDNLGIELPEPPDLPIDPEQVGKDENDKYFTYREVKNKDGEIAWYTITGLSDEGMSMQSLTVPKFYNDLPVHTIDANGFSGSSRLTDITVYNNITSIEAGAFAGCTSLENLHIYNDDASSMAVDQISLFDGAPDNVKIVLYTEESYHSYVTGYFWANYGGKMILADK